MRSHRQIIRAAGADKVHAALSAKGITLSAATPFRWADRDSIPGEYWAHFAESGFASLDELAAAAKREAA